MSLHCSGSFFVPIAAAGGLDAIDLNMGRIRQEAHLATLARNFGTPEKLNM